MQYNLQGRLSVIGQTEQKTEKFSLRNFVVEIGGQYPQLISLQFVNDKCAHLDDFELGDEVKVDFNILGKAWTSNEGVTKYFNTLNAYAIHHVNAQPQQPAQPKQELPKVQPQASEPLDLPF